jgi:hypothetical protein
MIRRTGRAYVFVRWSGFSHAPGRLGEVAWAFESVDRLGRSIGFHCGAVGLASSNVAAADSFSTWTERCSTLPELVKTMSGDTPERAGYDEVKVFEVENADPESALQAVQRGMDDSRKRLTDALEETREILLRYGTKGLPPARSFSAPFLWYNMLPGRSVAIRKLPVHLFQLRAAAEAQPINTSEEVEDQVRRLAANVPGVKSLGESFVARVRTGFIVGINIAVQPELTIVAAYAIAQETEDTLRKANSRVRHVFVQVIPYETLA